MRLWPVQSSAWGLGVIAPCLGSAAFKPGSNRGHVHHCSPQFAPGVWANVYKSTLDLSDVSDGMDHKQPVP